MYIRGVHNQDIVFKIAFNRSAAQSIAPSNVVDSLNTFIFTGTEYSTQKGRNLMPSWACCAEPNEGDPQV